jgi:nucleoside 2-deoxyribosyltransferase
MTFKVFISSSVRDMQIVRELKEILERYGIIPVLPSEVILPMPIARVINQQIQTSDCVLVIVGRGGERSETVNFELGVATALNKPVIPIVEEGSEIPENLINKEYILMDRNRPKLSYERAAQYLSRLKVEKETRNAIGGLLLLGLGLLLLSALASSD